MTETPTPITLDRAALYCGDSRNVLPLLEPEQFTACVCDPPYHLTQASRKGSPRNNDPETPFGRTRLGSKGFMGKTWDGGDVAFRPEFWIEVLRVLKPGAMLLAFGGTRTFHRLTCAVEDAGFEIRDCLMWLYGSGLPKSLDISKALDKAAGAEAAQCWDGWGTSLKPAWESVIVAQKPMAGITAEAKQVLEALKVLEARLWSLLPASVVETHFESSQVDYEKVFAIAQWTVEDSISIQDDLFEEMDTPQYVSVMVTLLNTVSSWRSILGEHCEAMSMSTIAMEPKPTIDWTTLNSCLSEITLQSIIQVETLKPGSKLSALPAASYLNAVCASIVNTRELSAAANATSQDVGLGLRPS